MRYLTLVLLALVACTAKAPQQDTVTGEVVAPAPAVPLSDPYENPTPSSRPVVPQVYPAVEFTEGHHNIRDDQVKRLNAIVPIILDQRTPLLITGQASTSRLADQRARAVYDYLAREGVPTDLLTCRGTKGSSKWTVIGPRK